MTSLSTQPAGGTYGRLHPQAGCCGVISPSEERAMNGMAEETEAKAAGHRQTEAAEGHEREKVLACWFPESPDVDADSVMGG